MFKVNNKDTRTTSLTYLKTSDIFIPFSSVSIGKFEQVNACWDRKHVAKSKYSLDKDGKTKRG